MLIGIVAQFQNEEELEEYLDELEFLTYTAGGEVIKRFSQKMDIPNPKTFIGSGKIEEVRLFVEEHDITDCGAAWLASIAAYYKLQIPIARIRQQAGTDKKGTNVLGLLEAAQKLGFEAKGVRGDFEGLSKIPKPAIAHVIVKEKLQHYVVIYEVTKKHGKIMDPGDGKMHKKSHEEFKKEWTGVLGIETK